jgi:hypothetical protein
MPPRYVLFLQGQFSWLVRFWEHSSVLKAELVNVINIVLSRCLLCLVSFYYTSFKMYMRSLHRVSCSIFPSACGCKTIRGTTAMLCAPTAGRFVKVSGPALAVSSVRSLSTDSENASNPTFKEKITLMWKNYGKVAIGTYITVYLTTISSIYFALDFGVFNAATFGFDHAAAILKVGNMVDSLWGKAVMVDYISQNPKGIVHVYCL